MALGLVGKAHCSTARAKPTRKVSVDTETHTRADNDTHTKWQPTTEEALKYVKELENEMSPYRG